MDHLSKQIRSNREWYEYHANTRTRVSQSEHQRPATVPTEMLGPRAHGKFLFVGDETSLWPTRPRRRSANWRQECLGLTFKPDMAQPADTGIDKKTVVSRPKRFAALPWNREFRDANHIAILP
jgi:hypothetical protein